jgi:benzodiazapine receptor
MKAIQIVKFITSMFICQAAGILGSFFTTPSLPTWYVTIEKPSFTPPDRLFAPVWIALFALMGIALFLIWRKGLHNTHARIAFIIFMVQLVLNTSWSAAFFGFRSPLAGCIIISALWVAILITILTFHRVSRFASILLIPYILWVSFAAVLNFSIMILNRM